MEFRYFCDWCGKCHIGARLPGTMTCNCQPPRQISGLMLTKPLTKELTTPMSASEAYNLRAVLCKSWGIKNKTHDLHKGSYDSNQTLVQLITNIVEPVSENDWGRVRGLVKTRYNYDITTGGMDD